MKAAKENDDLLKIIEARKAKGTWLSESQATETQPSDDPKA